MYSFGLWNLCVSTIWNFIAVFRLKMFKWSVLKNNADNLCFPYLWVLVYQWFKLLTLFDFAIEFYMADLESVKLGSLSFYIKVWLIMYFISFHGNQCPFCWIVSSHKTGWNFCIFFFFWSVFILKVKENPIILWLFVDIHFRCKPLAICCWNLADKLRLLSGITITQSM